MAKPGTFCWLRVKPDSLGWFRLKPVEELSVFCLKTGLLLRCIPTKFPDILKVGGGAGLPCVFNAESDKQNFSLPKM